MILASNAIITGDVFVSGNTVFGDTSGDTTTFRSTINSNITPTANNTHDLGAPDLIWRGIYADSVYISNDFTATGDLNVTGSTTLGDSVSDNITFNARAASSLVPNSNNSIDLGKSDLNWSKVYSNEVFVKDKLYVTGDLINGGNLTVTGNLNITGNTKLGDSTLDTIDFTARSSSNLTPASNNNVDLGENNLNWRTIYVNDAYVKNNLNTSGDIFVGSDLDITGDLSVTGSVKIGDSSSDRLSVRSRIDTNIEPESNNTRDLGSSALNWRALYSNDIYVKNNLAVTGDQVIGGNLNVTGNISISGNTKLGDSTSDNITFTARSNSNLVPSQNNSVDLGQDNLNWKTIYADNQFLKTNLTVSGDADVKGTLSMQGSGVALSGVLSASGNYLFERISDSGNSLFERISTTGNSLFERISTTGNSLFERISTSGNSLYERENSLSGSLNNSGYFLTTKIDDLSGVTLLRYGDQFVSGNKTFVDDVTINNLYVTGTRTIFNTVETNIESPFILLNITGGTFDGGIFFVTGTGLTGVTDPGPIIGFDHSNNFVFGISTRSDDLSALDKIAAIRNVNDLSGALYLSGLKLSGTFNETGYFLNQQDFSMSGSFNTTGWNLFTGINNVATNLRSTGDALIALAASMSGSFNATGLDLYRRDESLSGSLNQTGYYLNQQDFSMSGSFNTTGWDLFTGINNVATNLRSSGDILIALTSSMSGTFDHSGLDLSRRDDSLSGFLLNNYITLSGNAEISGVKNFLLRPTLSGQGLVTLDQVASVDNTLLLTDVGQTVSGDKNFLNRITIDSVPVLVSGDSNLFYTTGDQTISDNKVFSNNLSVFGSFTGNTGLFTNGLYVSGNLFTSNETYSSGDYISFKNLTGSLIKSSLSTGNSLISMFSPEFFRSALRHQAGYGGDFTYQPSIADRNVISLVARNGYFPLMAGDLTVAATRTLYALPYTQYGDFNFGFTSRVISGAALTGRAVGYPGGKIRNLFDSVKRFSITGASPLGANVPIAVSANGSNDFGFTGSGLFPGVETTAGSSFQFLRGTGDPFAGGYGGFYFKCRFGLGHMDPFLLTSLQSGYSRCRAFIGMWDGNLSDPTTTGSHGAVFSGWATAGSGVNNKGNIMGIGFNSGDKYWSFVHNDNAGTPTLINLGPNYPTYIPSGAFIDFSMVAIPNSGAGFYASILGSGHTADISYLTYDNLPIADALLSPNIAFGTPGQRGSGIHSVGSGGFVFWTGGANSNSIHGLSGNLDGRSPILEACINNIYIEALD